MNHVRTQLQVCSTSSQTSTHWRLGELKKKHRWVVIQFSDCKIALTWMSVDLNDNTSKLLQVMAWCRQPASYYLSQWWLRCIIWRYQPFQDCGTVLFNQIKTSHSYEHWYNTGFWLVLYALVSPKWSHVPFWGQVCTMIFPTTKLCPCVNELGGSMSSAGLCNSIGRASAYSGHVDYKSGYGITRTQVNQTTKQLCFYEVLLCGWF